MARAARFFCFFFFYRTKSCCTYVYDSINITHMCCYVVKRIISGQSFLSPRPDTEKPPFFPLWDERPVIVAVTGVILHRGRPSAACTASKTVSVSIRIAGPDLGGGGGESAKHAFTPALVLLWPSLLSGGALYPPTPPTPANIGLTLNILTISGYVRAAVDFLSSFPLNASSFAYLSRLRALGDNENRKKWRKNGRRRGGQGLTKKAALNKSFIRWP